MIPPHTVFLLQFAKYRPECARKISGPSATPVAPAPHRAESAPLKKAPARRVSPLRRLFTPVEVLTTRG